MATHIPRPQTNETSHSTLSPEHEQALLRGLRLEPSYAWSQALRFSAAALPLLWLLSSAFCWWLTRQPWSSATIGLAIAFLALPLALLPHYLLKTRATSGPRLSLRDRVLRIHNTQHDWKLSLDDPFSASLLYREHKEDALLILQTRHDLTQCIYGRFRMDQMLPPHAIPVSQFSFSLAQIALDQLGASMLPDKDIELMPSLISLLQDADGYSPLPTQLPLLPTSRQLRFHSNQLLFHQDGLEKKRFPYTALSIQPFAYTPTNTSETHLILQLNSFEFDEEDSFENPEPIWLAIDWPTPLWLDHLPRASERQAKQALILPCVDALLLLQTLERKGAFPAPFSLLQPRYTPT